MLAAVFAYHSVNVIANAPQSPGPPRDPGPAARLAVVAALFFVLVGCSEEEPTDYSATHREAFLDACSRPLDDPRLLSDVCGCVYDRIEDEVPFDQFQTISDGLLAPGADLPEEITEMVADCFVEEADL